ncbi:MAG: polyprenyl synthetase family protein, partial [Gemmatimonadales bacterium]
MAEAAAASLLAEARELTDERLAAVGRRLEESTPGDLGRALRYALGTAGKRVRPALVLAGYRAAGGTGAGIAGLAAAVEIIHTYSLVHDDLPCMDDDAQRRGRPTTHVVFDPVIATRVGYLLVPVAVEVLGEAAEELGLAPAIRQAISRTLLTASGIRGMVGGQWLDLEAEGCSLVAGQLTEIHARKTGALIEAACVVGGLAAGAKGRVVEALAGFGRDIGLAFQVADDVLDATATTAQLGKTAGRDASLQKSTYVSFLGVDGAREEARRLVDRGL